MRALRRATRSSAHSCFDRWTTDEFAGGTSAANATGSALMRSCPSWARTSNLYFAPSSTPGTKSSQIPLEPSERIGCSRPSQLLKSPTTETERAFGAHTANAVPVTPLELANVRAEPLVQLLVAPFADEMQVELAERRQECVRDRAA